MASNDGRANNVDGSDDELAALLLQHLEEEDNFTEEGNPKGQPTRKRPKLDVDGCPPHPGFMGGICIRCGTVRQNPTDAIPIAGLGGDDKSSVALKYIHHGLEVSRKEAERLRAATVQRLLSSQRLLLVLDLDHTLLHSSRFCDLTEEQHKMLETLESAQREGTTPRLLYRLSHMGMWTKLRPGIQEFLSAANQLFDLHVFTMGDNDYAAGIAAVLDPDGRLFGGKVASSSDAGPAGVKDIDVLMGAEEIVLIIDDTVGVWPRHRDNLVQIERYIYFPACAVKFGRSGQSLMEQNKDEDADHGALATCLHVITDVHRRFFEGLHSDRATTHVADVRPHLESIRKSILGGCTVLFSRIFPKDVVDPSLHPLWQLAVRLGALCVIQEGDPVTHVVATDKTEKTSWAERTGKYVVSPDWLWSSALNWKKADEGMYPLMPNKISDRLALKDDVAAALAAAGGGT